VSDPVSGRKIRIPGHVITLVPPQTKENFKFINPQWLAGSSPLFCYLRFPDSVQFTNNSKKRCTSRTQANAKCRTRAPQKRSGFPVGNLRLHSVAQSSPFDSLIAQKIEPALIVNFTKGGKDHDHDLAIWSGSPSPPPNSVPLCRADKNIRNPPLGFVKLKGRTRQKQGWLTTLRPLFSSWVVHYSATKNKLFFIFFRLCAEYIPSAILLFAF